MRPYVWHVGCRRNSLACYYLIPKHVCCGSDGEDGLASLGHQQKENTGEQPCTNIYSKVLEISHKLSTQKCRRTFSALFATPLPVSLFPYPRQDDIHIVYTTCCTTGSPISISPCWPPSPVSRREVERTRYYRGSWTLVAILGLSNSLKFLEKRPTVFDCEQGLREDDPYRENDLHQGSEVRWCRTDTLM